MKSKPLNFFRTSLLTALSASCACSARAEEAVADWTAHFQATYVYQQKNAFDAPYSGPNSLTPEREKSYSLTATAFLGVQPWAGGELYLNPEVAQGEPLSNLTGLGGMTNGEIARTSGTSLKLYRARLYLRQTWNFGGEAKPVAEGPNQLPTAVSEKRFSITIGNLSLLDSFDSNRYSHDPRIQFMNWALVTYGAYDFAADARGYTWAAIAEFDEGPWAIRVGRALLPKEPNQLELDTRIFRHFGDQLEIVREYKFGDHDGAAHLITFRDREP
ncbi:MAG TPA: carbohydrate porin [Steroidobacteraceae bacterium]|nr:carbohydrate porin [Steroidobacteraceae bacterium]